jgi:plasmid maintenance system antidote protein VapI
MNLEKQRLFYSIKQRLPDNISYIDKMADVLDISYDAMYRRLNNKTLLSFPEAIQLAKHFDISLDSLYNIEREENLNVLKKCIDNSYDGLTKFFDAISDSATLFSKLKRSDLLYAAKEIPVYYLPKDSLYTKFKLFVFSSVHAEKEVIGNFSTLKEFNPPKYLTDSVNTFRKKIKDTPTTEIWNDTTINSTLYQIYYFYELKMIDKVAALQICTDLKRIIKNLEKRAINETMTSDSCKKFELYYNRLINLNNTVFFRSENLQTLFVPYTTMSYLRIDDDKTCKEIEQYFKKQLKFSKKISGESEIERQLFFASMYEKIEGLKKQIELKSGISFM